MGKFRIDTAYGGLIAKTYITENSVLCADVFIVDKRVNPPHVRKGKIVVPLKPIAQESMSELSDKVGWGWSDIKKAAKAVARKVGAQRLYHVASKVAQDASKYAGAIYPPLGVTYTALKKANDLLKDASSGSQKALKKIENIRKMAEKGNLAYAKAAKVLVALHEAGKKFDIDEWLVAQVSGWYFNKPYRQLKSVGGGPVVPLTPRGAYGHGMGKIKKEPLRLKWPF